MTMKVNLENLDNEASNFKNREPTKWAFIEEFLDREVNVDLSGGEKKRSELFQLSLKKPKVALLDEIDSGLDIDAIKSVANLINENKESSTSYVLVTHYSRILKYLDVDKVHVVVDGKVVKSGGDELIEEVDSGGYTQYWEEK